MTQEISRLSNQQRIANYSALLRVRHWHKNLIVLVAFFVAGGDSMHMFALNLLAVASFCAISSAVYILNDYLDLEADRQHPTKRYRPLTCGSVTFTEAMALFGAAILVSLMLAWQINISFLLIICVYFLLMLSYSLFLKNIAYIDVLVISLGFSLRLISGAAALDVSINMWLLIVSFEISALLGFSKRYLELYHIPNATYSRAVLRNYSRSLLKAILIFFAALTIFSYLFYIAAAHMSAYFDASSLLFTLPFVLIGIARFMYLVLLKKRGEDPALIIVQDKMILSSILAWFLMFITLIHI